MKKKILKSNKKFNYPISNFKIITEILYNFNINILENTQKNKKIAWIINLIIMNQIKLNWM